MLCTTEILYISKITADDCNKKMALGLITSYNTIKNIYLIFMHTPICLQDKLRLPEKEELEIWHVIDGLQPFSNYSLTVACSGDYGLWSDWSEEVSGMTLEASK